MKQFITIDQLNELSEKARDRLCKWCDEHDYEWRIEGYNTMPLQMVEPLLSIGQLIEILDEQHLGWVMQLKESGGGLDAHKLCDNLWKAAKEILEK